MTAWNPSKPIAANLLDFHLPARFFIEQDETTVDDRTGWATPRKRPRRVFELYAQTRRVDATVVVFTPPDVHPDDFAVASKLERLVERITYLMISAAQSLHETTVVARQTTYRPTPRILGRPE